MSGECQYLLVLFTMVLSVLFVLIYCKTEMQVVYDV